MRTSLAAATVAASVIGGSAVALVLTPSIAGAQDDAGDAVEQTDNHHRGERLDALAELLGMDPEAVQEALRGGDTIASLAATQSVDVQVIINAMVDAANEHLADAVEDGRLTQAEADDKAASAEERATAIVNGEADFGRRGHRQAKLGQGLSTAAETIGVDVAELRDALQNDASIADVATEQGVDIQSVVDALVAEREAHLADAVENGRIDQDRADEISEELSERVTAVVNGEFERPERGNFRGGPGGDQAPADASTEAELPA